MSPPFKKRQVGMMLPTAQVKSTKMKNEKEPGIKNIYIYIYVYICVCVCVCVCVCKHRKLVGKPIKCIKGFSNVLL